MLFAVDKRPKDSICVPIQRGLNMASNLEYVQYVAAQLSGASVISYKELFGECDLWYGGRFFGTIENNQFYVEMTETGRKHLPEAEPVASHGGRPGMYLVEELNNRKFLATLVLDTCSQLPDPSPPGQK